MHVTAEAERALSLYLSGKSDEAIALTLTGERGTSSVRLTANDVAEMRREAFRAQHLGRRWV